MEIVSEKADYSSSTLYRVTKKIDNFYKSRYAIILFLSLSLIATVLQLTLFLLNIITVNDVAHGDSNEWIFWFVTTISFISSSCMLTSNVLTQRENKYFIYFALVSLTLSIINVMMTKSYLVGTTQIISLFLIIQRYFMWTKHDKHVSTGAAPKVASKRSLWIVAILVITYCFILSMVVFFFGEEIYDPQGNGLKPEWTWWLDVFGSTTIIASMLLINLKNKYGFLFQAIGPLTGVLVMAEAGQFIMMINLFILSSMAFTTFLSWIARDMQIKHLIKEKSTT